MSQENRKPNVSKYTQYLVISSINLHVMSIGVIKIAVLLFPLIGSFNKKEATHIPMCHFLARAIKNTCF